MKNKTLSLSLFNVIMLTLATLFTTACSNPVGTEDETTRPMSNKEKEGIRGHQLGGGLTQHTLYYYGP